MRVLEMSSSVPAGVRSRGALEDRGMKKTSVRVQNLSSNCPSRKFIGYSERRKFPLYEIGGKVHVDPRCLCKKLIDSIFPCFDRLRKIEAKEIARWETKKLNQRNVKI